MTKQVNHSFINAVYFVSISLRTLYCPEIWLLFCLPMELATSRFIGTNNFFLTSYSFQIISTYCFICIGKLLGVSWALVDPTEGWGPTMAQLWPNQGPTITQSLKKDIRRITERIWLIRSSRKPDVSSFLWLISIQRIVSFSL